jgi:hypothetical protein
VLLWEDWTPSTTPATIRQWVDKFQLRYVEPGNEDFYNYGNKSTTSAIAISKATAYAKQIKAIHAALAGTGCQVLAQFDFPHWAGVEVKAIQAAVPDFPAYVDGITIHPYIDDVNEMTDEDNRFAGEPERTHEVVALVKDWMSAISLSIIIAQSRGLSGDGFSRAAHINDGSNLKGQSLESRCFYVTKLLILPLTHPIVDLGDTLLLLRI